MLELEDKLNRASFENIPLGALSANFLYSSLFFASFHDSLKRRVISSVLNLRESVNIRRVNNHNEFSGNSEKKTIVLNISANLNKNIAFFEPVYPLLDEYQKVIISKEKQPFMLGNTDTYVTFSGLNESLFKLWENSFRIISPLLRKVLKEIKRTFQLPYSFIQELTAVIKYQTKASTFFKEWLTLNKPVAIITDHDRHDINSPLVLTGRQIGIPTFTFIHGSTYPPDHYHPLLAEYMICWGQEHVEQFGKLGISKNKLIVCGNQKATKTIAVEPSHVRQKWNIKPQVKVAVLATNVIEMDQRQQYAGDFCKSVSNNPTWKGIIRIHPSENLSDYNALANTFPQISFTDNRQMSFDESLAIADVIVCHNSLYGLDALIKGKAVMIYTPPYITFPLGIGEELVTKGGCRQIQSQQELEVFFRATPTYTETKNSEAYVDSYIAAFGNDAAQNIYTEITKRIHK